MRRQHGRPDKPGHQAGNASAPSGGGASEIRYANDEVEAYYAAKRIVLILIVNFIAMVVVTIPFWSKAIGAFAEHKIATCPVPLQ